MATVKAENPDKVETKTVDQSGKVYVGNAWAGQDIEIIVSVIDDSEN